MAAAPSLLVSADPTRQSCDCLRNVFSIPDVVGNNPEIRLSSQQPQGWASQNHPLVTPDGTAGSLAISLVTAAAMSSLKKIGSGKRLPLRLPLLVGAKAVVRCDHLPPAVDVQPNSVKRSRYT